MNKLKKESVKHCSTLFTLFITIGFFILWWVIPSAFTLFKTPTNWEDIDFESKIEGQYVKVTLSEVYGPYSRNTVKKHLLSTYYSC